jgi:hypothetical protein
MYLESLGVDTSKENPKRAAQEILGINNIHSWFRKNAKNIGKG